MHACLHIPGVSYHHDVQCRFPTTKHDISKQDTLELPVWCSYGSVMAVTRFNDTDNMPNYALHVTIFCYIFCYLNVLICLCLAVEYSMYIHVCNGVGH